MNATASQDEKAPHDEKLEIAPRATSLKEAGGGEGNEGRVNRRLLLANLWSVAGAISFGFSFSIFGAALSAGSVNVGMLIAGRRGVLGGSAGVGLSTGYIIAAWTGFAFYFYKRPVNWRVPLILQCVAPVLILATSPFVPESPRWLLSRGRSSEAMKVLERLHEDSDGHSHGVAAVEHAQISAQVALDQSLPSSWWDMATTYRRRTLLGMLVTFSSMACGGQVAGNYGPLLYADLGFDAQQSLLIAAAGWTSVTAPTQLCASLLVDRIGRVPLLVFGVFTSGVAQALLALCSAKYDATGSQAWGNAAVAMLFLIIFTFSISEPATYVMIGEIVPFHLRAKGVALSLVVTNLTTEMITQSAPTALKNIKWRYYLLFFALSCVCAAAEWRFLPEVRQISFQYI
ncbi:hypothetical protein RQP46_011472 [Phenoliferia psychrophenolica]